MDLDHVFDVGLKWQQITVKAATTLSGRVAKAFSKEVVTPWEGVNLIFPSAEEIANISDIETCFGELGVIRSRSRTISVLANKMHSGNLYFDKDIDVDEIKARINRLS